MTRQGSFKRAARQRAREFGIRYSTARAELETANRQAFADARPFEREALKAHLEAQYGVRITSLAPIDDDPATRPRDSWPGHYPSTLYVKRADGASWIARIYSASADTISRVQGDAEILRFLAEHEFPAERIAHDDPVSVHDGSGLIVTEVIAGGRPAATPEVHRQLGTLLGRLHTLPEGGAAVQRDGGSEEKTDSGLHVGRPKEDLAAAMSFLVSVEDSVPEVGREGFERLRDYVENADDAEGLPEALTHGNFHAWAAVGTPGNLSIVGWAGSGRGPRLPALAWLLTTAAEGGPESYAAALAGYTEHVELTDQELGRLPGVLSIKPLWLACLDYRMTVRNGGVPNMDAGWTGWRPEHADRLAAKVISALQR